MKYRVECEVYANFKGELNVTAESQEEAEAEVNASIEELAGVLDIENCTSSDVECFEDNKYRVYLRLYGRYEGEVEVEADSQEEAEAEAIEQLDTGVMDVDSCTIGEVEVIDEEDW